MADSDGLCSHWSWGGLCGPEGLPVRKGTCVRLAASRNALVVQLQSIEQVRPTRLIASSAEPVCGERRPQAKLVGGQRSVLSGATGRSQTGKGVVGTFHQGAKRPSSPPYLIGGEVVEMDNSDERTRVQPWNLW